MYTNLTKTLVAGGQATAPTAGAAIATIASVPGGTYLARLWSTQAGTLDTGHLTNLQLQAGTAVLQTGLPSLTNPVGPVEFTIQIPTNTTPGNVTVNATAAFAAGAIVAAVLTLNQP